MSGWGPWPDIDTGLVHVVPCDSDKNVIGEHQQSLTCWCQPRRDDAVAKLIVHHDRKRGGLDS